MTRDDLICYLDSFSQDLHPLTGDRGPVDSCLREPGIRAELMRLVRRIQFGREQLLCREEVAELLTDLRGLGYQPDHRQVAKVLTGSRSIVDSRLKGLLAYARYRGILTQRSILTELERFGPLLFDRPDQEEDEPRMATEDDWKEIDFFSTGTFDKLSAAKADELGREVQALGLRRATDRLPAYMSRARQRLPRAFEPWSREEKALLIEAMCYTNDLTRLEAIFGRSASSLERQGKQLIHASRQKSAA